MYNPTFKQDPLPCCTPKEKMALDLNYYPQGYIPEKQEEEAPLLVNDLVNPPENKTPKKPLQQKKIEEKKE